MDNVESQIKKTRSEEGGGSAERLNLSRNEALQECGGGRRDASHFTRNDDDDVLSVCDPREKGKDIRHHCCHGLAVAPGFLLDHHSSRTFRTDVSFDDKMMANFQWKLSILVSKTVIIKESTRPRPQPSIGLETARRGCVKLLKD